MKLSLTPLSRRQVKLPAFEEFINMHSVYLKFNKLQ